MGSGVYSARAALFAAMNRPFRRCLFFIILITVLLSPAPAETDVPNFPAIARLDTRDTLFRQYLGDVETARGRLFNQRDAETRSIEEAEASFVESLTIYAYTPKAEDDLLALAARCNIPYATLASLNHLPTAVIPANSGALLLPSIPGLFVPEDPRSDLEMLLRSSHDGQGIAVTIRQGGASERFRFIPGADFSPTERAFFLHPGFRFPLRNYRLTSAFGPRINPVTGNARFHHGLDLAAPMGTEVFAAREGVVSAQGQDPIYGNYIIISHGDWSSLYGHWLKKAFTALAFSKSVDLAHLALISSQALASRCLVGPKASSMLVLSP